jgi:phenylalanyl-tRNA synthetase beta subunit
MRIPVNLVNQYLKNKLTTNEIVSSLEKTEIEVEEIIDSIKLDKNIITAKIIEVDKHPNADRLKIVRIEINNNKTKKIVCGAPNVESGQIVAYAKPGAILPNGQKISSAIIRDIKSDGMLCSARELSIGEDHDGIVVLDPDLPLSISLCDIVDSQDIIDIKTPANRFDMLSIVGVAREISANSKNNQLIEPKNTEIEFSKKDLTKIEDKQICKHFISARIKINKKVESPQWLVDNLIAAGMRPINVMVDITNFVMLETGQPSHAYDANKIKSNLGVRYAKNNEELTTLDGVTRKLCKDDLIIVDSSQAIGLAGVMGGKDTETDINTTEIFLEIANFDKTVVRKNAQRHGIRTEASTRYEKGLPLPLQVYAANRLVYLFKKICAAEVVDSINEQLYDWPWIQHVGLRVRKAEKFLGMKLDEKQIVQGLQKRGFEAEHFSIVKEARKHLGKPYKWGANFKQDGTDAFDCGYFVDYIYSLIGKMVGHQCLELFESGTAVGVENLKPGDAVFRDGPWEKLSRKERKGLSHVAIYVGNGKIIHAADTYRDKNGKWKKFPKNKQMVIEEKVEVITKDPDFRGARRYVDNFNHIIAVTAPWWREDVRIEQDLYEECAKIVGYENMPTTLPSLPPMQTSMHQNILNLKRLRQLLVDRGLFEVMSYSFVSKKHLQSDNQEEGKHLKVVNPLSLEQEYLRSTLLSSHLQIIQNNKNYSQKKYGFFEISKVYEKDSSKVGKSEKWQLGITIVGSEGEKKIKSLIDVISARYRIDLRFDLLQSNRYEKGISANIVLKNTVIGNFGQLSNKLLKTHYKILTDVSYCELNLDDIELDEKEFKVKKIPNYQLIYRDVTLEIDNKIWWQEILDTIKLDKVLKKIEFIGEFKNDHLIQENKKRISFRLVLDLGAQPSSSDITSNLDNITDTLIKHPKLNKPTII